MPAELLGQGGTTLACNVRDKAEVAQVLAAAEAAGAEILRPASDVFWGGHIGYFRAPDGCIWEIAWNPMAPLSAEGAFRWKGYRVASVPARVLLPAPVDFASSGADGGRHRAPGREPSLITMRTGDCAE